MGAVVLAAVLTVPAPAPAQPAPETSSSDWRLVRAGDRTTCAIRTTGRLFCWGDDDRSQLGNGGANTPQPSPVAVAGGETTWTAVTVGHSHACGVRGGRLACWGMDDQGQLGDNASIADQSVPTQVAGGGSNWRSVAASWFHTCAIRAPGRMFCWGSDGDGRLGNGPAGSRPTPGAVAGGHTDWTAVSTGYGHTCGIRQPGRLYCWGLNDFGQLGDGTETNRVVPKLVAGGITNWRSVTTGELHTCARRATGHLYCWGDASFGQLGIAGATTERRRPGLVSGGIRDWTTVVAGAIHTCARRSTGRLYCWGADVVGQLGDDVTFTQRSTPRPVIGGATDWVSVAAGGGHTCATIRSGRLYCWGRDDVGQLGNAGDGSGNQPLPVQVWP
jgi:alpha-tubulin suppressor-like RCC1 family protein